MTNEEKSQLTKSMEVAVNIDKKSNVQDKKDKKRKELADFCDLVAKSMAVFWSFFGLVQFMWVFNRAWFLVHELKEHHQLEYLLPNLKLSPFVDEKLDALTGERHIPVSKITLFSSPYLIVQTLTLIGAFYKILGGLVGLTKFSFLYLLLMGLLMDFGINLGILFYSGFNYDEWSVFATFGTCFFAFGFILMATATLASRKPVNLGKK